MHAYVSRTTQTRDRELGRNRVMSASTLEMTASASGTEWMRRSAGNVAGEAVRSSVGEIVQSCDDCLHTTGRRVGRQPDKHAMNRDLDRVNELLREVRKVGKPTKKQ